MTFSPSLRTKRHKCSRKVADQALIGKLFWWSEEWHTGRFFLGKMFPPWKDFRHASSFKVNCRYRQLWAASPKHLASWMHNSGLLTTEIKPIFKANKLKGDIHLHPVLNRRNLWACPFFKKPRHCSYVLKMGISTVPGACCSLSFGMIDDVSAWQLLNASGMPG